MRTDKLTIKAQEAIHEAQQVAERHNHQALAPEHLLFAGDYYPGICPRICTGRNGGAVV